MELQRVAIGQFDPYPGLPLAYDFIGANNRGVPFFKQDGLIVPRFEQLPSLSVLRPSPGTHTDSAGNVLLFAAGQPRNTDLGLLIEEPRTNQLTFSQQIGGTNWTGNNYSVTANSTAAPDGTVTAAHLTDATAFAAQFAQVNQTGTTAAAQQSASIFLKAAECQFAFMQLRDGGTFANGGTVSVTLSGAGAVTAVSNDGTGSATAGTITPLANGWYRVSITTTLPSSTTAQVRTGWQNVPGAPAARAGIVGAGIQAWGAQLEVGNSATSYIPTVVSTATRSAENLRSALASPSQGTLFVRATAQVNDSVFRRVLSLNDGTNQNETVIELQSGQARNFVTVGNVGQAAFNLGAWAGSCKVAIAFAPGDFASVINGGAVVTSAGGTVPAVTGLDIGSLVGSAQFNGCITQALLLPQRLTSSQLQALTA